MTRNWIFALCAALLLIGSCKNETSAPVTRGQIVLSDAFSGNYALTDMYGAIATPDRFEGKAVLIYFGFTSCPDVCPAALGVMSAALNELGRKADDLQPLFIALDPQRDTPAALASYLGFDKRILGLTGDEIEIETAKAGFKVYSERRALPGSALGYTIDHSSLFYFVDPKGKPQFAFTDRLSPQQLADFLRPLL